MCDAFYFVFASSMPVLLVMVVLPSMLILFESSEKTSYAGAVNNGFGAVKGVKKQLSVFL